MLPSVLSDSNHGRDSPSSSKSPHLPSNPISRHQKRRERRKQSQQNVHHSMYTQHFSNYRLPMAVAVASYSDEQILRLDSFQSFTAAPSERAGRSPLFVVSPSPSPWDRLHLVACPCSGCRCSLHISALLGHYLNDHMPSMGIPLEEVRINKRVSLSCHFSSLENDINTLLGVYVYRRHGLNPLKCQRNTHLPAKFRHYSQHDALMVFACRTQHSMLWQKQKTKNDVLAIWVSTPLQKATISLRLTVQTAKSSRYYSKELKARPIHQDSLSCKEFIKTDSNVILISFDDLREVMDLDVWQQMLMVELKVLGEEKF
ncbi:hypothetical protein KR074_008077 [Drosophila pseudoananassae]|nr:hypothetical protein KR074_008077 [Drosophila pseudoananassae]